MAPAAPPPIVEFDRVSKHFGATPAVRAVSFAIQPGEVFALLGPSGCGKTTTLRLLAGFETPDADGGTIRLAGEVVNARRPYERRLGMVFQHYALFPHLSVERNVAFGLEQARRPADEIRRRVRAALELVRLEPDTFGPRRPDALSGGQRQRVALARALVLEPRLLLLDEPLGALDLQLRKEMQLELKRLNRELGITFVVVTHDQAEALVLADRIAVMGGGRLHQVGTPAEVYEQPRTRFVAGFLGEAVVLAGRAAWRPGGLGTVQRADGSAFTVATPAAPPADGEVEVALRPEWLDLVPPGQAPAGENALPATVEDVIYLGETLHVLARLADGSPARVALRNEGRPVPWRRGDAALLVWDPADGQVLVP
ncbi:MAG: ABC transporter ATP-binding protein [Gemmatimonadales bacterium]|nr:ABC transporter ATP-binding protein [Gemmatimonadales bacterium]